MSYPRFKLRALAVAGCVAAALAGAACSSSGASGGSSTSGVVTVAVVSNPLITRQLIPLTSSVFEKQYPGITVKFATYTEGDLRAAIEKNVSTHSNAFNVIMIGPYEAPLFAKNGWLTDLSKQYIASDSSYDAPDLGSGPGLRGQAQPARQGGRDLPARPGRLGRQHGGARHRGEHVRRPVVR